MRDTSSIFQQRANQFLEHIEAFSDLSRVHHTSPKNGGFPVFMIDNREYYEQSYFDELIENSVWRYLVNGVFHDLFTPEYCSVNNLTCDWQEMRPPLTTSYVERIEERYPIEFIITRNGKREGYRYTNCYKNKERMRTLFESKGIDSLSVIDFSSGIQSSFLHPLVVPQGFDGLIHRITLKDFFCGFFTEEEYSDYSSKATSAVKEAYQYVGKQTITNLTYQQRPFFLKQVLTELSHFSYSTKAYKPTKPFNDDASQWYDKGILPSADFAVMRKGFFDLERYRALTGKKDFAKSFITSEYLYQTLTSNNVFDLTAIVTGYFKSIEQLLYQILKIIERDGHKGNVWIQSTLSVGSRRFARLSAQGECRLTPGKPKRSQIRVKQGNSSYYDTTFAALVYMLQDYDSGWVVSPTAKDFVSALLLLYSDECRNEHFHKDNINDPLEVTEIRDKTYLLLFYVLGGYDFSKSSQDEKTLLGITDNSFESFYQKLLESGPGNYYYLQFGSKHSVLVAMPMQQEPPRYDKDGLLINPSLRFVIIPRETLGNWRSDDWGQIEAEFASDKTIILSRNNMPSAVKYVDKVTGNTSDIVW